VCELAAARNTRGTGAEFLAGNTSRCNGRGSLKRGLAGQSPILNNTFSFRHPPFSFVTPPPPVQSKAQQPFDPPVRLLAPEKWVSTCVGMTVFSGK
jgi:hypothetical protein